MYVCYRVDVPGNNEKEETGCHHGPDWLHFPGMSPPPCQAHLPLALGPLPSALMGWPQWTCFWP